MQQHLFKINEVSLQHLIRYKDELQKELSGVLNFWQKNTVDEQFGGFFGKMDNSNKVFHDAPKGSVLNSRILWTFSAAYNLTGNMNYLETAERAFRYIIDHFIDKEFGGVYWSVDFKGDPCDAKKQIYALSFAIYGLSEFYWCNKNQQAKELAIELYNLVVEHSYDIIHGGYIEALSRDWKELNDLRLSNKDANEKKSMTRICMCWKALPTCIVYGQMSFCKKKLRNWSIFSWIILLIKNPITWFCFLMKNGIGNRI